MKKVILSTFICACAFAGKAQTFYAQGGLNLANISTSADGSTQDNKVLPTFNVGFMSQFGISSIFDLESGILLQGRGAKAKTTFGNGDYFEAKFNPLYVEVPLNAVIKFPLGGGSNFFVNAGPYVAIGVGGKTKLESKTALGTTKSSSSIKFSKDDPTTGGQEGAAYDRLKRFDYGANFGVGVKLSSIILKANYGLGLAKINSLQTNNSENDKNKYRTLSFSVGVPL